MLTSRQRQAGWLFAIGCVLLIFGIWLWISSGLPTTAYICDQSPQTHKEECASYNIAFVTVWHVAKFFDDHNGTFSALFAAAVAVLTWYLCKATIGLRESTDKLWDAGERQIKTSRKVAAIQARQTRQAIRESERSADAATLTAKAAIGVELPKVFIYNLNYENWADDATAATFQSPRISIQVKNYGRTPAFLRMQSAEMQIGGWLPEEPVYPNAHDLESGRVIESRDPYDLPVARLREPPSEKTIQSILEGKTYIWVYGYVFYRDFLNDPHMLRFCAHWYIYNGPFLIPPRFIEDGPPKYTESY